MIRKIENREPNISHAPAHVHEIFSSDDPTFSFEFFPPKSVEGADQLFATISRLESLKPSFVSVTYGAGGSTRQLTHDLVVRLRRTTSLTPIPHLTCVCHQEDEIRAILERYDEAGIRNVLALAGDVPRDRVPYDRSRDAFRHAGDLVAFIRSFKQDQPLGIGVAGFPEGHPETPNRLVEMDYLKAKVDAGADYICTQLFFDNRDFYDFRERCELVGIRVPILAGIMPITTIAGMKRMAELAAGAKFPAPLIRALQRAGDDAEAVTRVGVHWASEQCRDLLDHRTRGIHFYTLNRSDATRRIYENLGVTDSRGLRDGAGSA